MFLKKKIIRYILVITEPNRSADNVVSRFGLHDC